MASECFSPGHFPSAPHNSDTPAVHYGKKILENFRIREPLLMTASGEPLQQVRLLGKFFLLEFSMV